MKHLLGLHDFASHGLSFFILTSRENAARWPQSVLGQPARMLDADAPENRRFAFVLNAANGAVYGGVMGMPFWVMMDCGLMPGAFFGVMGPAKLLPEKLRHLIDQNLAVMTPPSGAENDYLHRPLGDDEIIPLAEACGIPSVQPETIVAYSLYSLYPGLGTIAKAAMLSAYGQMGMKYQIGIGQFDNKSFRIHTRFGALEILNFKVALHSLSHKTLYYRLTMPSEADLIRIAGGETEIHTLHGTMHHVQVDNLAERERLEAHRTAGDSRYYLVAPGMDDHGHNTILEVKTS